MLIYQNSENIKIKYKFYRISYMLQVKKTLKNIKLIQKYRKCQRYEHKVTRCES